MILDCTAGFRKMWKGKHQGVLFLDIRREVKPDIVASNESMPFRDGVFQKIIYDPPHLIRNSIIQPDSMMASYAYKFSYWQKKEDFLHNLVGVNKEAKRILKENGILFVKHTESPDNLISHRTVLELLDNFKVKTMRRHNSSGFGSSVVCYITMTPYTADPSKIQQRLVTYIQ